MANKDILQYLRETPHNTNVNVVKGMIGSGSGSGAIEMETVFEDDITFTYQKGQYSATSVSWYEDDTISMLEGYLKITLDDTILLGTSSLQQTWMEDEYVETTGFSSSLNHYDLFSNEKFYTISISYSFTNIGPDEFGYRISAYIMGVTSEDDSDLQAYCQTLHHLKIEWFTI